MSENSFVYMACTWAYSACNLVHVMQMLGHRAVQSTLIYTHLIKFEGDEYHSAVAKTIDEAKSLIEAGFEYVCTHEGTMLFRKRK